MDENEILDLKEKDLMSFSDAENALNNLNDKILEAFKVTMKEVDKLKLENKLKGDK